MAKSAKKKAVRQVAPAAPPSQGVINAGLFFDEAEKNAALEAAITVYQEDIIALATTMGFAFDYEDMQEHLISRWDVKKPTKKKFCCT